MGERAFLAQSVVFYGLVAAAAFGWGAARHETTTWLGDADPLGTLYEAGAGIALGAVTVVGWGLLERRIGAIARLSTELSSAIPTLSAASVAVVSGTSSIGEELFFRGAMQSAWGWPAATAVFAVLHGLFIPKLWVWMLFAAVTGTGLSLLMRWQGSLLGPIVAHFTINFFNLSTLMRERVAQQSAE